MNGAAFVRLVARHLLLVACLLAPAVARAQWLPLPDVAQPLIGEVRAKGDRVPQKGVDVIVDNDAARAVTDADGHFVIEGLTRGVHVVHFRGIDITSLDQEVQTRINLPTVMTVFVAVKPRYVSHVKGRTALSAPVEQTVSSEEIRHIAGTQGDVLKATQNLPGLARAPFNGGLLAVWGSAPNDTRVYVDGVEIPTIFHFGGIRSTINPSLVDSLTLLPGGYGVEHGRGLGGVIDVTTRAPRTDGLHGYAQADIVDVGGLFEGNIGKKFSFGAAFRVSVLEYFLPYFLDQRTRFEPKYWDYQLKLRYHASARDDVDLFFLGSDDDLAVGLVNSTGGAFREFDQHTWFHRAILRWQHRFDRGASLAVTGSVGYDVPYGLDTTIGNGSYFNTDSQVGWSLRAVYQRPIGRMVRVSAGVDYEGTRFTLDARQNRTGLYREGDPGDFLGYTAPDPTEAVLVDHTTLYTDEVAPFVALTLALLHQRLFVMPQFRLECMSFVGTRSEDFSSAAILSEPRLATRVRVSSRVWLQGSIGVYHQPPGSADFSRIFGNPNLTPEMAIHYVAGVEVKATSTLQIELQGFYKDLRNLVVRGVGDADPPLESGGIGRVYGGELLVRQELWKNFFGWISYTLMRSERRDHPGDPWRVFQYDQTHILTVLGSYKLPLGFQVGLRFRYVTGNPYTPVARAYYDINGYQYIPIYGAPYSGRLPAFNQLDLRVDKTFEYNTFKLTLYLDIQNVYNSTSAEGVLYSYDYKTPEYLNGLPFLPVLGARADF